MKRHFSQSRGHSRLFGRRKRGVGEAGEGGWPGDWAAGVAKRLFPGKDAGEWSPASLDAMGREAVAAAKRRLKVLL